MEVQNQSIKKYQQNHRALNLKTNKHRIKDKSKYSNKKNYHQDTPMEVEDQNKPIDNDNKIVIKNQLPIQQYKKEIIETIKNNRVTIICGETGSGKTTQIPQFISELFNKILITQPRRISAITLAQRVAYEMGVALGEEVGYNVRFQQKRSQKTKISFVTDGMAIRELMIGRRYDVFIIDQAHERSINTDVLMAILKKMIHNNNKQKIVIMSATIDASKFMHFFNTDALINVKGRSYPTQIYNIFQPTQNYLDATFNVIFQIHQKQQKGDILVFLTGQDQITSLFKKIEKTKQDFGITNIKPLMLYSALPYEYQHLIFTPDNSVEAPRRVILATNIAQTSVTISGVKYVVDCGLMKVRLYDSQKMLDMLTVVPVAKANALQRSGRAGRQSKGKCFRLYLKNDYQDLKDQMIPQILRSELSGPILQLKAIGVQNIAQLQFMDQPSIQTFNHCLGLLRQIKCLKQLPSEAITEYGYEVSKIPLPPLMSHLLISSLEFKCADIVLSVLSILTVQNIFYVNSSSNNQKKQKAGGLYDILRKYLPTYDDSQIKNTNMQSNKSKFNNNQSIMMMKENSLITSDHLAKINLLHQYIKSKNKVLFCKQNMINKNSIKRSVLIRDQLKDYLGQIITQREKKSFQIKTEIKNKLNKLNIPESGLTGENIKSWIKCVQKCCIYNIAKLSPDSSQKNCYLINKTGQKAFIHPESLCFYMKQKPKVILFGSVVKTAKVYLKDITPLEY